MSDTSRQIGLVSDTMSRPGPRRLPITIRLRPDALAWVWTEAGRRGITISELVRQALARERRFSDR